MEILLPVKLKCPKVSLMRNQIFPGEPHINHVSRGLRYSINSNGPIFKNYWMLRTSYDDRGSITQMDPEVMPLSVELEPILDESQFDRVVSDTQRIQEPVLVLWSASWCRKCIYLKPKLERLAADYYPRIRFYSVDVNKVPHQLVVRAGVKKMPTIQLWKDGKKQDEVIGGHSAHLAVNEIREMVEDGYDSI